MNIAKLKISVEKSNVVFKKLNVKYPDLDSYLVFSSPYGQCRLTTDVVKILNSFPQMIVDSKQKEKGLQLLQKIADLESENKKSGSNQKSLEKFKLQLSEFANNLEMKDDTFVEIRFNNSNLDLICELQKDELISQKHTPQTKASIRIVLGAVGELY